MAHAAKNLSETLTFKILHMLNLSTWILLRTERQKKARWDLIALVQPPLYIFHKTRDEGNCDQIVRDSQTGHAERKGAVTSCHHISLLLWKKQSKAFLCCLVLRMVTAAGADRAEWTYEAAKCTGAVQPLLVSLWTWGSFPPLTYAGKRGLVHMSREQFPQVRAEQSHFPQVREKRHH